jgi:hypothetical protein
METRRRPLAGLGGASPPPALLPARPNRTAGAPARLSAACLSCFRRRQVSAPAGSRLLTRAIPSSFLPFVAPKADCNSALRPWVGRVWPLGVGPARTCLRRLAGSRTLLSPSRVAPAQAADKNVRAPFLLHCRRRISLAQEVLSWLVLSDKKGPLGRRARR